MSRSMSSGGLAGVMNQPILISPVWRQKRMKSRSTRRTGVQRKSPDGRLKKVAERDLNAEMAAWQKERDLQAEMDEWKASQTPEEPSMMDSVKSKAKGVLEDWRDLSEGIGVSGIETYQGIKDLIPGMEVTDNDRATLKKWREASDSGWGTAGRITGEAAQMALPAAGAVKLAKTLNKAKPVLAAALPAAGEMAAVTGHGALQMPDEGETRLDNATNSAKWGAGGLVLGKALKAGLTGAKGTEAAQRLRDAGAKLTAGQTVPALKKAENILGILPFTARATERARNKSVKSLHDVALRKAAPPTAATVKSATPVKAEVQGRGHEAVNKMFEDFNDGYDAAWGTLDELKPRTGGRMDRVAQAGKPRLAKKDRRVVDNLMEDIRMVSRENPQGSVNEIDTLLRNTLSQATKKRDLNKVITGIRDELRSSMPDANRTAVQRMDKAYRDFSAVNRAAGSTPAGKVGGEFTTDDLLQGSRQAGNMFNRGRGKAPMQDFVNDSYTARGTEPSVIPTTSRRIIQALPDPTGLQGTINRRIAGTGLGQKKARDFFESELAEQLRKYATPARIGAAYGDN